MQSQGSKLNRTKEKRKLCAHLAGWFCFVAVEFENLETLLHTGSQFVLKALADAPLKHLQMSKEIKRERESVCVCVCERECVCVCEDGDQNETHTHTYKSE